MAILSKIVIAAGALASITQAAPVVTVTDVVTITTWVTSQATQTVYLPIESSSTVTTPSVQQPIPAVQPAAPSSTTSAPAIFAQQVSSAAVPSLALTTQAAAIVPIAQPTTTLKTSTLASARSAAPSPQASSGSTGGACSSGSPCAGDVTHWDGGLGACGWSVDTNADMQIALPVGMMGAQSNGNPYCGKSLTIKNPSTGALIQATVGDKCMGCTGNSIDLTNVLFKAVTGNGDGRVPNVQWWFN